MTRFTLLCGLLLFGALLLPACEGVQKQPGLLDLVIGQPSADLRVVALDGSGARAATDDPARAALAAVIHTQSPDLVAITRLPHEALLALLDDLPAFDAVGAPSIDGESQGVTSAILFRRGRLSPSGVRTFWLSSSPTRPGSRAWGQAEPGTCTTAIFSVAAGPGAGRSVRVFCFGLDLGSAEARVESARLIRRAMFDTGQIGVPVLLLGDVVEETTPPAPGPAQDILDGEGSRPDLLDSVHASRALGSAQPGVAPLPATRRVRILSDRSIGVVEGSGGPASDGTSLGSGGWGSGEAVTLRLGK